MKKLTGTPKRYVFRALLILLIVAMTVSGCGKKAAFESGFFGYIHTPTSIMLGVRSDTDTFAMDDVTLDLHFGTYDIGYCEKYGADPKSFYSKTHLMGSKIFFGLYICNFAHEIDIVNDMEIADYKAIDNYYFVGEISEEEAFIKEYGFTMSRWKGITYNHSEKITIPEAFFAEEAGKIIIKIVAFLAPINEGDCYYTTKTCSIKFGYQRVDPNTIKIIF